MATYSATGANVRIELDDRNVVERILGVTERKMKFAAGVVESTAERLLSVPQPLHVTSSGRIVGLNPSRPGEPPKVVYGNLRKSIRSKVTRSGLQVTALIGSNLPYARPLELGTNRMAARPFMRPALAAGWRLIAEGFSKA